MGELIRRDETWEPDSKGLDSIPAALLAAGAVAAISFAIYRFVPQASIENLYGIGVFFIVPFAIGVAAAFFVKNGNRTKTAIGTGFLGLLIASIGLLVYSVEGLMCLLMASPILALATLLGAVIGSQIRAAFYRSKHPMIQFSLLTFLPLALAADLRSQRAPEQRVTSTSIDVDAPPERVWPLLNNFGDLPAPDFWLFRHGVAYPLGSQTSGSGVGVKRICKLSTGDMQEVVEEWQPNKLLRFRVISTPACMTETGLFGQKMETAHLHGFYNCEFGQFELQALPGGRTRIVGTSGYNFRIYPAPYWGLWTDSIVHHVHKRVLEEIKRRAEAKH